MSFVPQTELRLLNVPFEADYRNVLHYTNRESQTSTLMGMTVRTFTDFTYQRKDNVIRVPAHIDSLWNCNYVMYRNSNFTNKWFYAFIIKMEYVNDGMTLIYIKTDVYNTWWFDCTIKPSFVEREHTQDDTVGSNTIPEVLETGEYIVSNRDIDREITSSFKIIVGVTRLSDGTKTYGGIYGGVPSGVKYYIFDYGDNEGVEEFINSYDHDAYGDAIQSIFMYPSSLLYDVPEDENTLPDQDYPTSYTKWIDKPTSIDGYVPRNKKLLTYPFTYLLVSNGQGSSSVLHWELFSPSEQSESIHPNQVSFVTGGTITPGGSIRTFPRSYNITANASSTSDEFDSEISLFGEEYGINLGKLPIGSWNNDVYINWLTQNSINIASDIIGGTITTGASLVAKDSAGLISGLQGIFNSIGEIYAHSKVSPSVSGNMNSGDIMFAMMRTTFYYYTMSIKQEYAKIIDDFFDMYGYKTNRVKIPNRGHRSRYWFTKTIDCNIDGAIPQEDLIELKNIYNDGVTFWRNPSEIENYDLSNVIVSTIL